MNAPNKPGCYLFKDDLGNILYVGKAKNLKKRVSSYFKIHNDEKTNQLVKKIRDVETIVTSSEHEALILESNLIKENQPKYNINLKDSKHYAYIQITDEDFPRVIIARQKKGKGEFFGPFSSADKRNTIVSHIKMAFKLRTCKRFPKRACLRFQMNFCDAPCIGNISKENYKIKIDRIKKILSGEISAVKKEIKNKMEFFSNKGKFEEAIIERNLLNAISILEARQVVERKKNYDQDVISLVEDEDLIHVLVFHVRKGILANKDIFSFSSFGKLEIRFEEFLLLLYQNKIPNEIIVPFETNISDILSKRKGKKVSVVFPKKGDKKKLLSLAKINAENSFLEDKKALYSLKKELNLALEPRIIECFDISTLQGSYSVGSMVRFLNGKPDKSNYRKFKIKTVSGQDDFKMMEEVVKRRYTRLISEKKELPDLIVIDGGKGQLSSASKVLSELRLSIPTIGLAKKFEEIHMENRVLRLPHSNEGVRLLIRARNEAHRFAINYHRHLREKGMFEK